MAQTSAGRKTAHPQPEQSLAPASASSEVGLRPPKTLLLSWHSHFRHYLSPARCKSFDYWSLTVISSVYGASV
jgi:hypothetical protein